METLGERIRFFRKQKKMTLETLAGDRLTKGMLSLIENNKANPSMESLQYIAQQLEVEVATLLEEEQQNKERQQLLEKAERFYYEMKVDEFESQFQQLAACIEPHLSHLTSGYEAARLLDLYGRACFFLKKENWKDYLNRASQLYDQLSIHWHYVDIKIFHSLRYFSEHRYHEALQFFQKERTHLEKKFTYLEPISKINLDYVEAVLCFAVGESQQAIQLMQQAITYSKKEQIFYQIDGLYRLAAIYALTEGNEDDFNHYLNKLTLFGEFTDNEETLFVVNYLKIHRLTSYEQQYEKALQKIEQLEQKTSSSSLYFSILQSEKGKALYGVGQYEKAIQLLSSYQDISEHIHHPFDLSTIYEAGAYLAKSYYAIGQTEEAKTHIENIYNKFKTFPDSPYKQFVKKTKIRLT